MGTPQDAVEALDLPSPAAWERYVGEEHGGAAWCDAETVAVEQCGYPPLPSLSGAHPSAYAEWRWLIRAAEADLHRRLREHRFAPLIRWTLAAWCRAHSLGPRHIFVRYPPCSGLQTASPPKKRSSAWKPVRPPRFTALIGEVLAGIVHAHPERASELAWNTSIIARSQERSLPHPFQVYTVWLAAGVPTVPTNALLRRDWDAEDDAVAAQNDRACPVWRKKNVASPRRATCTDPRYGSTGGGAARGG